MKRIIHDGIIVAFLLAIGYIAEHYGYMSYREYGYCVSIFMGMILLFLVWRRRRLLHSSFRRIDAMTGEQFEEYLMVQFKRKGYRVRLTPLSGDFGADLVMKKRRRHYVVQAKRYSGAVGIKAVQEVIGAMQYYDTDYGMVVTNSYYTKAARELAEASDIELWDRRDIMEEFRIP